MRPLLVDCDTASWSTRLGLISTVWFCSVLVLTVVWWKDEVLAAEWSATPSLSVKGVYNSNLLLRSGNNEVFGHWVMPAVKFKGATEALDVEGESRADFVRYYGDFDRDFTNLHFPLRASYHSDRHTLGFEGGFTRDNTLLGELQTTGLVLDFTQRNQWTAVPTWKIGITERLFWQSSYQFADTRYQEGQRFNLVSYQVHGLTAGPTYHLTLLDEVHLTGQYTLVRIPSIGLHTTYYGAQGEWTHDFGSGLIGSISGGGRLVSSTQDLPGFLGGGSITSDEVVWVYRGSLSKQFERTMVRINGSRELNPSGIGRLIQTDQVGASLAHNVSETLSLSLNGTLYFVSGLAGSENSRPLQHTRFFTITPSVSWKFAPWWSIEVSYSYRERTIAGFDERHDSNSMYIMLTYGGEKWSVSR